MAEPTGRPVLRRRRRPGVTVVVSLAALACAGVLVWFVVNFAAANPEEVNLGDRVFEVGNAERLAERLSEDREPLLFKDPLSRGPGRELYVHHTGGDPEKGWIAVEAYAPGDPHEIRCLLRWDRAEQEFVSPCSGRRFRADADDLVHHPVEVDDGTVKVDLRNRARPR